MEISPLRIGQPTAGCHRRRHQIALNLSATSGQTYPARRIGTTHTNSGTCCATWCQAGLALVIVPRPRQRWARTPADHPRRHAVRGGKPVSTDGFLGDHGISTPLRVVRRSLFLN